VVERRHSKTNIGDKGFLTKVKRPEDQIKIDFSKIFEKAQIMA
jgi:hypothetical protein